MNAPWVEVELMAAGGGLKARVSDSSTRQSTPWQPVGVGRREVMALTESVRGLARSRGAPSAEDQARARALYTAIFRGQLASVADGLRGQGRGPLLLRLRIADPALRAAPWEAMRGPTDLDSYLAVHHDTAVARSVESPEISVPREVRGAVRLLAVAPSGMEYAVRDLQASVAEGVQSGQLQWLDPAAGEAARWRHLRRRLQQTPGPHILHITCHGRVADGQPQLLLDPAADRWLSVELLATALGRVNELRLVFLESCSGGAPGDLASAAELLVVQGVDAVVAHLWPVDAQAARAMARDFYAALTGAGPTAGDVAASLNDARLGMAGEGTVDFLCPVLYLEDEETRLFDFSLRRLAPVEATGQADGGASRELSPRQRRLLGTLEAFAAGPSTVVVGDNLDPNGEAVGRNQLQAAMRELLDGAGQDHLSELMQRFALIEDRDALKEEVQYVLDDLTRSRSERVAGVIEGMAGLIDTGLFVTLLWLPLLEEALARRHPSREILVFQVREPGNFKRLGVFRRGGGEREWSRLRRPPERLEFDQQCVVLRLYGGYTALGHTLIGDPVLTEDDQLINLALLDQLPPQLLAYLRHNPIGVGGLSPLAWSHRELLRRLLGNQPASPGSLAILNSGAGDEERRYWESERGPAGQNRSVQVVRFEDLEGLLGVLDQ